MHTLTLESALDLPGHEFGRRRLVDALLGEVDCAVSVSGDYDEDVFVVARIEDVFDVEEGCWASEYGSELYPMVLGV